MVGFMRAARDVTAHAFGGECAIGFLDLREKSVRGLGRFEATERGQAHRSVHVIPRVALAIDGPEDLARRLLVRGEPLPGDLLLVPVQERRFNVHPPTSSFNAKPIHGDSKSVSSP